MTSILPVLGSQGLKVVPNVVFRAAAKSLLRSSPWPELRSRALGLHPRESIASKTNHAPPCAVIASEHLSNVAAEYLRKLEDLLFGRLGMGDRLMETFQYGLDLLDTGVVPIEHYAETLLCQIDGVECIRLSNPLNFTVRLKPHALTPF